MEVESGEEKNDGVGEGKWRWWAAASSAQMAAGIAWYRRGFSESAATAMPFKAFAIATLFVGAGAAAFPAALFATGIHTVGDMKDVGASIQRWMRAPPRETS
ncbi:uncharacterized protein [Typha latifolia]|uniref:uncharacterized protein n=1 Tax=Typha latifolia TaxID=4733 RepID=UPI003C2E9DC4